MHNSSLYILPLCINLNDFISIISLNGSTLFLFPASLFCQCTLAVQRKSNCELSLRLTVSADVAAVCVSYAPNPASLSIRALLFHGTTQNYCQVLQVTMTTKATSE